MAAADRSRSRAEYQSGLTASSGSDTWNGPASVAVAVVICLPASVRVYLCTTPCDMRRSFDGLHGLVASVMELDVVHVKASREVPHELPSWMTDASVCGRMEPGPPQLSISALIELREALEAATKTTADQGFVSSEDREGESDETASKAIVPAADASQLRDENSIGRKNAR